MTTFELRLAEALSEYAGPKVEVDHSAVARRAAAAPVPTPLRWAWRPSLSMMAAAVAVLAAVALAAVLLRSTFPPATQDSPSPQSTSTFTETSAPTSAPTPGLASTPSPGPIEEFGLEPGRYDLNGPAGLESTGWPANVSLEVPAGWLEGSFERNYGFTRYMNAVTRVPLASISGSSVEWITESACGGSVATRFDGSVSDLTSLLREMPVISASEATPITVDGYGGLLVTIEVPDIPQCDFVTFWQGPEERSVLGSRGTSPRGWSNDIYVLDVDGTLWVMQTAFAPNASDELREEVRAMVDSTDIAGPIGPRLPALGMPGTTAVGPGWYGAAGRPSPSGGIFAGMHWVVGDEQTGYQEAAEMAFATGPDCLVRANNPEPEPVQVGELQGVTVFPYEPAWSFGGAEGDEVTRAYALDVEGRTLCVFLTTGSSTTPEQMETALAIVESIQAVPLGEDGIRLIFNLADGGWDTG